MSALDLPRRPLLRYPGGKWRLSSWIVRHFPPHKIYTEAFGGAASVLLRKPRAYSEVYNDLDGEIVVLFRVLRNPAQARELERLLRLTPFAREEFESAYLMDGDPVEQARRTIVKSYMGFGSDAIACATPAGFRACSDRPYKIPAHDWASFPDAIEAITRRLAGVVIESRPAIELLQSHDGVDALHYLDPPYPHGTRKRPRAHRYRYEMTDEEHRELAALVRGLKGMVVLSGYACDLYDGELYPDWHRVTRSARSDGAGARMEVLWISPRAIERQQGVLPL